MLLRRTLILILSVLSLSCGIEEVKRSLVIVMDVTASMRDELNILRTESIKLLDNLHKRGGGHTIENYILVKFVDDLDERKFKVFVDTNYDEMKKELNNVEINRYDKDKSCLASCYNGLHDALRLAENDSIFLVFTDAGTNHKELLPKIKNLTQQKRITFYFTLTNGCTRTTPADDYRDLVSIYNGDIFNIDHLNKMSNHFQHLTQILTGPPFPPSVEIFVDSTMSEFMLTVTGRNLIITIFDPKQKYLSSSKYKMLTNIPSIKMIQVPDPMPGRYTIEIVSELSYSGQVQTKSDLQFKYGFSVHEPNSMLETVYAPLKDHNTYLAITTSNASLIDSLEHVILHTSDQRYKYELQRKDTRDGELFVTNSFPFHNIKPFKIHVYGRDHLKYDIIRLISPVIQAISGDLPDVVINTNITVAKGDPIKLICRVSSILNVTVSWSKIELNKQLKFLESAQSNILNYTIDKSETSDSGEYICLAENIVGKVELKTFVTVKPPIRLRVFTPIKTVNATVGTEMVELQCNVSPALIHVKVSWMFNENAKLPEGSQYILPNLKLFNIKQNFNGIYTCIGRTETEEMRDNIQLNVMYPPKILNLYNFNTKSYVDTTQPLEINQKAALTINCLYDGNPTPTVRWTNQSGDIVSETGELKIDEYNNNQSGEFSCQVRNELDEDKCKIRIIVTPEPLELSTTVRSSTQRFIPIPIHKEFDRPISILYRNSTVNNLQVDDTLELRVLETKLVSNAKITQQPQEMVSVIATTEETPSSEEIVANIILKPILLPNYKQFEDLIEGTPFTMRCPIESGEYKVTWTLNGKNIDHLKLSNGSIYFESVQANMKGDIICIASNNAGSANASIFVDILKPPYDLRMDKSTEKSLFINDPYVVKCSASGHPKPLLYWLKNEVFFSVENSITFDKIQTSDEGNYTCVADSYVGKINKTVKIQVSAHPHLPDETKSTRPTNQQSGEFSCQAQNELDEDKCKIRIVIPPEPLELSTTIWSSTKKSIPMPIHKEFDRPRIILNRNSTVNNLQVDDILELSVLETKLVLNEETTQNLQEIATTEETPSAKLILKPILLQNHKQFEDLIEGTSFTMRCPIESGEYNVTWTLNGKSIDQFKLSNGSIYFESVQANMKGDIICIASNSAGSANASISVDILKPPYDLRVDKSTEKNLFTNNPYVVKCSASGHPKPLLYWLKNGAFFSVENSITFDKIQTSDEGNYTCVADSYVGKINKTVKIQVSAHPHLPDETKSTRPTNLNRISEANAPISRHISIPPHGIQIEAPTGRTLFVNERYELKCRAKGIPTPKFYWTKDDIFAEIGNTITFEKVQLFDAGNYTCVAQNPHGKIQKTFKLQVFARQQTFNSSLITPASNKATSVNARIGHRFSRPPYDIQVEPSKDRNFFKCSAKGDPEPHLYWMKNEIFFKTGNSIAFQNVQPSNNGQYTCIAENYLGNINKTFILQIPTPPQFANLTDFAWTTHRNKADELGPKSILQFIPVYRNYLESNYEKIIEVHEYEKFILNCTMFGDPAPQIRWFKNNYDLNESNQTVLVYEEASMMDSGIYKCIGSNAVGQVEATFYVNVKKSLSFVLLSPSKQSGKGLSIECRARGNPLPTFRIYSDNYSTGTDLIFNQTDNIKKRFFQKNKEIYFEGDTIVDAKRVASLDRYGVLTYDRYYIGTFRYIIKSISSRDAGKYTCTAAQLTNKMNSSVTIRLKRNSKKNGVPKVSFIQHKMVVW